MEKNSPVINSEPILIAFDESGFLMEKNLFDDISEQVQDVVNAYSVMGLSSLSNDELGKLFSDPVDLVFDKMTGGQAVSIAGISVCKHKAIEILQKPVGYEELIEKITSVKTNGISNHNGLRRIQAIQIDYWFELNQGVVTMKMERFTSLQNEFKRFAVSEQAKKMLEFANTIIAKAEELEFMEYLKANPNGIGHTIKSIINGGDGKKVSLNAEGIIKFNNPDFRYN